METIAFGRNVLSNFPETILKAAEFNRTPSELSPPAPLPALVVVKIVADAVPVVRGRNGLHFVDLARHGERRTHFQLRL